MLKKIKTILPPATMLWFKALHILDGVYNQTFRLFTSFIFNSWKFSQFINREYTWLGSRQHEVSMLFESTAISGVFLITPKRFGDQRGYFMETFKAALFEAEIGPFTFVQDNCSFSAETGTVRGLHFQLEPRAQGKLVSCTSGALLDVAVDIRKGSPTYGQHVSAELNADNGKQLWVPPGFAHGFCTLEPNTVISYKVTDYYSAEHDRGLLWSDPDLNIAWPVAPEKAILSEKDQKQPTLKNLVANFTYKA